MSSGEFLTVFGPNGAGKSTLLSILSTFIKPSDGRVRVAGYDVTCDKERVRRLVGVISHNTMLYENLTAMENLCFIGEFHDVADIIERSSEMLSRMGVYSKKDDLVNTLSFGTRQRLAIARTFLHNPKILFLDEPYSGLDYRGTQILTSVLESEKSEKTIIMTTHNLNRGLSLCDRAAILDQGELVYISEGKLEQNEFQRIYASQVSGNSAV